MVEVLAKCGPKAELVLSQSLESVLAEAPGIVPEILAVAINRIDPGSEAAAVLANALKKLLARALETRDAAASVVAAVAKALRWMVSEKEAVHVLVSLSEQHLATLLRDHLAKVAEAMDGIDPEEARPWLEEVRDSQDVERWARDTVAEALNTTGSEQHASFEDTLTLFATALQDEADVNYVKVKVPRVLSESGATAPVLSQALERLVAEALETGAADTTVLEEVSAALLEMDSQEQAVQ